MDADHLSVFFAALTVQTAVNGHGLEVELLHFITNGFRTLCKRFDERYRVAVLLPGTIQNKYLFHYPCSSLNSILCIGSKYRVPFSS